MSSELSTPRRLLLGAVSTLVLVVVVIGAAWPVIVPRLIYSPRALPASHRSPEMWGYSGEEIQLRTPDGEDLHGWWLQSTAAARSACTVLFTHGNAGNVSSQAGFMRPFLAGGHDVLVFDYRGYGASTGRPSEAGLYIDAAAAFDYLTAGRGLRGDRILIVGHSLGSAVATELATRRDAAGLVLAAPFSSFPEAMKAHAAWLPVRLLRWQDERFESGSRIGSVEVPILVVAGSDDRLVPERVSRPLYDAAPPQSGWVEVPGGHNDVLESERFEQALARFIAGIPACAAARE